MYGQSDPRVVDRYGLVRNNEHLTVYYPSTNKALVFRVISRHNEGYETMNYGGLPIDLGDSLTSYDGGLIASPANGVIPKRSHTTNGVRFDLADTWDTTDMWYTNYTWNDRIFHVKTKVKPGFIRVGLQVPQNVNQSRFQRERVITGVDKTNGMGYKFGEIETVHFPEMHYGYMFGNDTNWDIHTSVTFVYGEYIVKIPSNPEFIFNVLTRREKSHWVGMQVSTPDATITQGLRKTWGFEGFTVYPSLMRDHAINEYASILSSSDVLSKGVVA